MRRADLEVVAGMVPAGSRVLDLGCGDGALLAHLIARARLRRHGIEIDGDDVLACIAARRARQPGRHRGGAARLRRRRVRRRAAVVDAADDAPARRRAGGDDARRAARASSRSRTSGTGACARRSRCAGACRTTAHAAAVVARDAEHPHVHARRLRVASPRSLGLRVSERVLLGEARGPRRAAPRGAPEPARGGRRLPARANRGARRPRRGGVHSPKELPCARIAPRRRRPGGGRARRARRRGRRQPDQGEREGVLDQRRPEDAQARRQVHVHAREQGRRTRTTCCSTARGPRRRHAQQEAGRARQERELPVTFPKAGTYASTARSRATPRRA